MNRSVIVPGMVTEVYTFLKNEVKLQITNVKIWFNNECLKRGLSLGNNSTTNRTKKQIERWSVKNKIKELYKKTRYSNKAFYDQYFRLRNLLDHWEMEEEKNA